MRAGGYFVDSVPFSCCDAQSPPPCRHTHVTSHQIITEEKLEPAPPGIHHQGCAERVTAHLRNHILSPIGQSTFYMLLVEASVCAYSLSLILEFSHEIATFAVNFMAQT